MNMLFIKNGKTFCQAFNSNPIAELLLISCGKTRNLYPTKCKNLNLKPYKINQRINTMYNSTNYNENCVENIKKNFLIVRG